MKHKKKYDEYIREAITKSLSARYASGACTGIVISRIRTLLLHLNEGRQASTRDGVNIMPVKLQHRGEVEQENH